ncbi:hypothetical protein B4U80_02546 [Leptotrombidium deliense]|uniref:Metalloendopeptidase n=1 Tax=Leptotrombidium deliense TaxID=299467 RepID=A0A443RY42_9ACAR|nr:hypothetical protein B4U80_02546 [Leptotrombidium deliense]
MEKWNSSIPVSSFIVRETKGRFTHAKTCIRFIPRNGHKRYITVGYDKNECGVAYGLNIDVGDACPGRKCGVFIHELGHHLGYDHEQDRPDRDEYIRGPDYRQKDQNLKLTA